MTGTVGTKRQGFTLIELLVVIAILGVLVGLLIPAIGKIRESASRTACANNLRTIGQGLMLHHDAFKLFPSNGGWDAENKIKDVNGNLIYVSFQDTKGPLFYWGVGEPGRAPRAQPGSWAFAILPFIELRNVYDQRAWGIPQPLYICPSRRSAAARIPVDDQFGQYQGGGWAWAHTDYGANARVIPNRPDCLNLSFLTDGSSNTILVGEKAMNPENYLKGSWYWDEPYFLGGSGGTQRGLGYYLSEGLKIIRDSADMGLNYRYNWGSAHDAGAHFLFADGSVRLLQHGLPLELVLPLLTPDGGEVNPEP